jgi:hypothetical protein
MCTSCKRVGFLVKCLLLVPLFVLAVGCSKEGTVSGKVYYKGKLLQSGAVNFVPEGKGNSVGSPIGKDGSYSVSKVPAGLAKISVVTGSAKPPSTQEMQKEMGRGAAMAQKGMEKQKSMLKEKGKPAEAEGPTEEIHLPEKYSNPDESGLSVEVKGGKQVHDIKID